MAESKTVQACRFPHTYLAKYLMLVASKIQDGGYAEMPLHLPQAHVAMHRIKFGPFGCMHDLSTRPAVCTQHSTVIYLPSNPAAEKSSAIETGLHIHHQHEPWARDFPHRHGCGIIRIPIAHRPAARQNLPPSYRRVDRDTCAPPGPAFGGIVNPAQYQIRVTT